MFSEWRQIYGSLSRHVNNSHSTTKIQVIWEVYSFPTTVRALNKAAIDNQKLIHQVKVSPFKVKCSDVTNVAVNIRS